MLRVVLADELLCPDDGRLLRVRRLHQELVAEQCEMVGEDGQQNRGGFEFPWRCDRGLKKSPSRLLAADVHSKFGGLINGMLERRPGRFPAHHVAGLQKADGLRAELHRHGGFAQAVGAGSGGRFVHGIHCEFLLRPEASGAGMAIPGHHRAEPVSRALVVE